MSTPASTVVSRVIDAPPGSVYRAFLDPVALASWLPPGAMRGVVHDFDGREGGCFRISLIYPEGAGQGKTSDRTDTVRGRFVTLIPDACVVWATTFESADPSFAGEMTVETTLVPAGSGTEVTIRCENIPPGVRPADNETGCRETLAKLAAYLAPPALA
jgi:uncharacterized protein YndB with AHSA1/START domain